MWDLKYRPQVFSDVLGQDGAAQVLQARLLKGEAYNTSYIFAGGHGCGKTTLSRILARAMLCQALTADGNPCNECDHCKACLSETMSAFSELDAASQGTTADMRRLVDDLSYPIPGILKRIYLLDEAHRMSRDAQDVLLKPIEDKRVVVIFCTTELSKIRGTIGSRCEVHEIRKIGREDILKRMVKVLQEENVEYEEDAVLTVIDLAKGHVRDTLNKLETVAQLGPVTLEAVRERLNLSVVSIYYEILLSLGDPSKALPLIELACDKIGPTDVSAGLAEAAMNAYRQAIKISADFAIFDRESAGKLHEMYGSALPGLARFFLHNPYPTRLSLACDILSLCESGGTVPQPAAAVGAPPVVIQAQVARFVEPQPQLETPLQVENPPQTAAVEVKPVTELPKVASPPVAQNVDPQTFPALTTLDHKAIPSEHPRGSKENRRPPLRNGTKSEESRTLTPAEFRQALNQLLRINAKVSSG